MDPIMVSGNSTEPLTARLGDEQREAGLDLIASLSVSFRGY